MVPFRSRDPVWFSAFALIGCVTAFSASQGLTYPLLGLILEKSGESSTMIGLNAAMTPLGIICSAPLLIRYSNVIDRIHVLVAAILATIVILLLIGLFRDPLIWFILRFLLGCTTNAIYVLSETTLIEIAPSSHRGRLLGAYTSITTLGYATGPIILAVVGVDGITPFIITAMILSVAIVPLFAAPIGRHQATVSSSVPGSIPLFLRVAWILVFAYAATTLFDNAFMSLFISYGIGTGVDEREITIILSVILLGGVAAQIPLGWLVDRTSNVLIMSVCLIFGTLGFLLFPIAVREFIPAVIVAFVWGAAVLGIQTVALFELGRRFKGRMLVAGNASFSMMWGVSGIVGVPASGAAMEIMGPSGLMFVVGGIFSVSTALLIKEATKAPMKD